MVQSFFSHNLDFITLPLISGFYDILNGSFYSFNFTVLKNIMKHKYKTLYKYTF